MLNERCRVFLELAEILSDSIADTKMSTITWIVIVLIVISIGVTVTEVGLRFALLEREKGKGKGNANLGLIGGPAVNGNWTRADFSEPQLRGICGVEVIAKTFAEL